MEIEFLENTSTWERIIAPMVSNLERLGVKSSIRIVDRTQYQNRVQEYDYDIVSVVQGQSHSPGNEQREYWTSAYADQPQSRNLIGLKNPAIDSLVETLIRADSREELNTAARALDRVLRNGFYVVPQWYLDKTRIALWDMFDYPQPFPEYNLDLSAWWVDPEREADIRNRQRSR